MHILASWFCVANSYIMRDTHALIVICNQFFLHAAVDLVLGFRVVDFVVLVDL